MLAAADVEPVDGHDDVAGLKAEGFTQGLKINLKTKKHKHKNNHFVILNITWKFTQGLKINLKTQKHKNIK